MENNNNENIENMVKAVFEEERNSDAILPPPYMKTRILARFREKKQKTGGVLMLWKQIALSGAALAIVIVFGLRFFADDFIRANLNTPLAVKVEIGELKKANVAYAEIVLPDGVVFYSKKFPELNKESSLVLDWEVAVRNGHLPFIIEGIGEGNKVIVLKFYDLSNRLIAEKTLKVSFDKKRS
ncbi:MAG: hypothetical protein A2504_04325 [Bdellovibrionales bacterium RIFOXYD12_FULL_39_22]|nr:MAG: hypothetical protein A2385_07500 [Bdellovibrionales bacterium RIFOXYB1_FULL_39_21]OFZ42104.1 MAG: hypothetical protein A2485_09470 [Bdellovibrionales bacterium RIFOXYC12_FULL_39_17]OFZ50820.1 MAG: hypothetical protein A2404_06420 [Bdellovibrionales bacterium RIFOXYC1_FULL_39_130]OFZ72483.1 MAG: hypothetical protein A2451_10470 [Bdellovibrionales bacterium RIFOXYC2_FULL_39_8]OFZ78043.1 MAG: hypothetical protein A2560_01590 [Bdellovibrionales bacterium RIFOXYD1_FULL_39_84]OFZ93521.1 MAG: